MLTALAAVAAGLAAVLAIYAARLRRSCRISEAARRNAFAELESLHGSFSRFVPSAVVDRIIGEGIDVGAEKKEVTILFADLKGFTRMSEAMDPTELVDVLNGYFRAVTSAITQHQGRVTKFMGDGLMALFGALAQNPWQARDAVDAALAMRESLERYNRKLTAVGRPPLSIGVGIHRGVAIAGVVGSPELMEYTVLGDVVNVAARVESLTRDHDVDILVTHAVWSKLDASYRCKAMPPMRVKGKSESIETYAVERREDAQQ